MLNFQRTVAAARSLTWLPSGDSLWQPQHEAISLPCDRWPAPYSNIPPSFELPKVNLNVLR